MTKEEQIEMTDEAFPIMEDLESDESDVLTLDDMKSSFIKNPPVGESVSFTVRAVKRLTGDSLKGKTKTGDTFEKNLSKVKYGFEIYTADASKYTVPGWEVWGKLKSIFNKLGVIEGAEIKIAHLCDGMKSENKKKDKYAVTALVDGEYRALDRETREWFTEKLE